MKVVFTKDDFELVNFSNKHHKSCLAQTYLKKKKKKKRRSIFSKVDHKKYYCHKTNSSNTKKKEKKKSPNIINKNKPKIITPIVKINESLNPNSSAQLVLSPKN